MKKRFANTYKFCNHDNKYQFCCNEKLFTHTNTWMIGKNSAKQREGFYFYLNVEDITDTDYTHARKFKIL